MPMSPLRFTVLHLRRGSAVAVLIVFAVLLELTAGTGLSYLAGFHRVWTVLHRFDAMWLITLVAALLASFVGYHFAYRGIFRVEGGPVVRGREMRAVVAAGFGGFLAHGGGELDKYALRAAGADEHDAKARVSALAGLEHGVLAIGGCAAAILVLVSGLREPALDFTLPWAIAPVPGFAIAFWAAERYRDRFAGRAGWRGKVATFIDSIHIIRVLFFRPLRWGWAILGMALFWVADAVAVWAGLAAFGLRMNAAALFVGFATGMVFTRRTGPLAGAGILALVLPLTLVVSGSPFAIAIAGVFAYRILALLLPLPASLAALPTLRSMAERAGLPPRQAEGKTEPALRTGSP